MTDPAALQEVSNLLERVHRRNKNQHRVVSWWRSFSMLRRCVARLAQELECVETNGEQTRTRMCHLQTALLPQCYRCVHWPVMSSRGCSLTGVPLSAFTQLVADPQFCALGLVLLSALAVLQSVIQSSLGKPAARNENTAEGSTHLTLGLEVAPLEDLGTCVNRPLLATENLELLGNADAEEKVTVKRRVRDDGGSRPISVHGPLQWVGSPGVGASLQDTSRPAKRKKESKDKGRNAIDDLFNALT